MGAAPALQPAVERFVAAAPRHMLIDGRWVEAASGRALDTLDPATGAVLARVAEGDAEDVDRAVRAARRAIRAGTLRVNCYNVFGPEAPFGGYKESGYGREQGRYALDLCTQVKTVWMRI